MSMYEVVIKGEFLAVIDVAADSREEAELLAEAEVIRVVDETGIELKVLSTEVNPV